jgi:outer membrane murein-binding lipoprotein Lpp
MKRIFLMLAVFTGFVMMNGCKDKDKEPELSVPSESISATAEADSYELTVASNTVWTAKSDAAWCELTHASAEGDGAIVLNVAENTTQLSRTAKITVTAGSLTEIVTLVQAAATEQPDPRDIIKFAFERKAGTTGNSLLIVAEAEGIISIDWGDNSDTEEYDHHEHAGGVLHTYEGNEDRATVQIKATGLYRFQCGGSDHYELITLSVGTCPSLTTLNCSFNGLRELDVSKNTALEYLYCQGNQLTTEALQVIYGALPDRRNTTAGRMFIGGNPGAADHNRITADNKNWDVQDFEQPTEQPDPDPQPDPRDIIKFTFERKAGITGNGFKFVAEAESIISIDWGDGSTEEYDHHGRAGVSHTYEEEDNDRFTVQIKATGLYHFQCGGIDHYELTALSVGTCPSLTTLDCSHNDLGELFVSQNTALTVLKCSGNKLTALNVSQNTALESLHCQWNQLTAEALNGICEDLPRRSTVGRMYIGDNPGTEGCDRTIANDKGWGVEDFEW